MNNSTQQTIELTELKKQREQKNLSVQAVADSMKVRKDFVSYIESGEFEKLGAPTFVRGHVSNYCKVLGIEPAEILAQVPDQYLQHQQLKTSNAMGSSPLSHVRQQSNHVGRYVVGTTLLAMLCMSFYFIWDKWSLPHASDTDSTIVLTQQDADSKGKKKVTYSSMIPQVSDNNKIGQQDATGDELSTDDTNDEMAPEAQDNDEILTDSDDSDSGDSERNENQQEALVEVNLPDQAEPLNSKVSDQSTVSTKLNSTGYSIVMEFEEQAWVSIKTLDGEKVVQDLLGPGLREIHVTEPVHFRIGNAKKMQLTINDDVIELSDHTKQNVADFDWPLEPNS